MAEGNRCEVGIEMNSLNPGVMKIRAERRTVLLAVYVLRPQSRIRLFRPE